MDHIYYVDHRKRSLWIPNFKVGSRTIDFSIAEWCNGRQFRVKKSEAIWFKGYRKFMTVRHPLDRLRSYWEATIPAKQHDTFPELVDALLNGYINLHTVPQSRLIEGFCEPEEIEVLVNLEDLNDRRQEIEDMFSFPLPIGHRNKSPANTGLEIFNQISPDKLAALKDYYSADLRFGYTY